MVGKAVEINERMQKTLTFFGSSLEYQQDLKQALISPPANIIPVFQTLSQIIPLPLHSSLQKCFLTGH